MKHLSLKWINIITGIWISICCGPDTFAQFLPDKTVEVNRIAVLQQIGSNFFGRPGYTYLEGYTKDSSEGQLSYRSWKPELSNALVIRPGSNYAATWYSDVVPAGTRGRILFAFQVAIDLGSRRTFDLYLNGIKRFRFGDQDASTWQVKTADGELAYYTMHIDAQGDGHGYLLLDAPAGWVTAGKPVLFEIKPDVHREVADWFMIFKADNSMASLQHELNSYTHAQVVYEPTVKKMRITCKSACPEGITVKVNGQAITAIPGDSAGAIYETVLKKAPVNLGIYTGNTELAVLHRFAGDFSSSYYKNGNAVLLQGKAENAVWTGDVQVRYSASASNSLLAIRDIAKKRDTIYFMNSSHQDIGWMDDPQKCELIRDTLLVAPMLERLRSDPAFHFDLEDVLTVKEYIGRHPEDSAYLQEQLNNGRINVGGSFNMSYEEMYGGESNVREFYAGALWMKKKFNYRPVTYWNMDVPGKTLQMPQILAKAGIQAMMISRFKRGLYRWAAPDSSKVWMYSPGHYGDFYFAALNEKTDGDINAIAKEVKQFTAYSPATQPKKIPLLYDMDMTPGNAPHPFVAKWNGLSTTPYLKYATSVDYLNALNSSISTPPVIYGERTALWIYIHGPGHHHALDASRKADITLTAAEKFATIDALLNKDMSRYPAKRLEAAWEAKIYPDHGWGGRNGLTTDNNFLQKFLFSLSESTGMLDVALRDISGRIVMPRDKGLPLVVFNSLSWTRSDPVTTTITFPGDQYFAPSLRDAAGQDIAAQWSDITYHPNGSMAAVQLTFVADSVPATGYKTFYIRAGNSATPVKTEPIKTVSAIENKFFSLQLGNGKIQSLRDKALNKELLDAAATGGAEVFTLRSVGTDAFEASKIAPTDMHDFDKTSLHAGQWKLVEDGPVYATIESAAPVRYADVIQQIRLYKQLKRIDFYVTVKNWQGVLYREFRWNLPVNKAFKTLRYEVPFAVLEHGKDELKGAVGEKDTITENQHIRPRGIENWIGVADGSTAVTLSSSVAVADYMDATDNTRTAYTIQPVLLASRQSCHFEGPPYLQTGHHDFRFVLFSHADDNNLANRLGRQGNDPLRVVVNPLPYQAQDLPEQLSFFAADAPGVMISAVKKSEENDNVVLRLFEYGRQAKTVKVTSYFPLEALWHTNLLEERKGTLPYTAGGFNVSLSPAAIETFELGF